MQKEAEIPVYETMLTLKAAAVHGEEVIANLSGTRLYTQSSLWGRVWKVLYYVGEFLGWKNVGKQTTEDCVRRCHRAFCETKQDLARNVHVIQEELSKRTLGLPAVQTQWHARKVITQWADEGSEIFNDETIEKISQMLRTGFPEMRLEWGLLGSDRQVLAQATAYQHIFDLESVLGIQLPMRVIENLATGRTPQEAHLRELLVALSDAQERLELKQLHNALAAAVKHFQNHHRVSGLSRANLGRLECALYEEGLTLLRQSTEEQAAIAERVGRSGKISVREGASLAVEALDLALPSRSFPYGLMALEGQKNCLLYLPCNSVWAGIERELRERAQSTPTLAPMPAKILRIGQSGGYALMERLRPLELASENDVWQISDMLRNWMDQKSTPKELLLEQLGNDAQGYLCSYTLAEMGPFDRVLILDLLEQVAEKSSAAAKHVAEWSAFIDDPCVEFFHKIVERTALSQPCDLVEEMAILGLGDARLLQRGEALQEAVRRALRQGEPRERLVAKYEEAAVPGRLPSK